MLRAAAAITRVSRVSTATPNQQTGRAPPLRRRRANLPLRQRPDRHLLHLRLLAVHRDLHHQRRDPDPGHPADGDDSQPVRAVELHVLVAVRPAVRESRRSGCGSSRGTSAFIYLPFYVLLIVCLSKGYNWIQLYA